MTSIFNDNIKNPSYKYIIVLENSSTIVWQNPKLTSIIFRQIDRNKISKFVIKNLNNTTESFVWYHNKITSKY